MKALRSNSICTASTLPLAMPAWSTLFLALFASCGAVSPEDDGQVNHSTPSTTNNNKPSTTALGNPHSGEIPVLTQNEVIVECERHIRAWQVRNSNRRNDPTGSGIKILEEATQVFVGKYIGELSEVAIGGQDRPRGIASTALGFSKDPTVLPILLNNLSDSSDLVVANTLFGLAMYGDPDIPLSGLEAAILRPKASLGLLRNAAFALVRLAQVRQQAIPPKPVSEDWGRLLAHLLSRPEPEIRAQGATGLGYLRAGSAVPRLANMLAGDPESRVRFAAAFALGEIGSKAATTDLLGALSDPDSMTAGAARAALTKIVGRDFGPNPEAWKEQL
ncbi:MAG: HEAT repeat domain-containing protein [Planctomycetes bacterium]|nr:HEAT repeat domain-containing protein [Planctomycetota bacterium]